MDAARLEGQRVLADVTRQAIERLLLAGGPQAITSAESLYSDEERQQLADQLAATLAPAELLGRARIRERADGGLFSQQRTTFAAFGVRQFDETSGGQLAPMAPKEAVDYFRNLVPTLNIDDLAFVAGIERDAFMLAAATDLVMLARVQDVIGKVLETGEGVSDAPMTIDRILDEAGVSSENPQYAEMVVRTNMMDSYNVGAQRELDEVSDSFPVWRYSNPDDGRSHETHAARNGNYYPTSVPFAEVRGDGPENVCNCRCVAIPIHRLEWAELEQGGAKLEGDGERLFYDPEEARDDSGKWTEGGGAATATQAHPGAAHGSKVAVKPSKARAFNGSDPVELKTSLTKQETGRVGEAVALAYLHSQGMTDARPMNSAQSNFPVDMIEDHAPTEVKAGLASNGRKAQQWRLTFSKESKVEQEKYVKMTPAQREKWNTQKQARIHERKEKVLAAVEKQTGKKQSPRTLTLVINPDTRTADVYVFDGWHDRIDWQSDAAKSAYQGSVKYGHA